MKTCFDKDASFSEGLDEGTLQAYLDGELSTPRAGEVAAHIAMCERCAAAARAAAQEFALFATALGADDHLSVPTGRLRARLDARIAELQPAASHVVPASQVVPVSRVAFSSLVERLRARAASLSAQLAFVPRPATAFASLLVAVVLLATIFFILRPQTRAPRNGQPDEIAKVNPPTSAGDAGRQSRASEQSSAGRQSDVSEQAVASSRGDASVGVESGSSEKEELESDARRVGETSATRGVNPVRVESVKYVAAREGRAGDSRGVAARANDERAADPALLAVEKSYVSAIASLKSAIDQQGARTMTPTLRAEYERNLAVVDQAIVASRVAAQRDPADKDAQDFLRAAYQDKLDLLHAVSDQTQLASIAR